VAFPQSGVMRWPGVLDLLDAAVRNGADLVGGIDPLEIDRDPKGQLDGIFAIAARRGVGLDIHRHEPGEMGLFNVQEICARTKALGLAGKVTISSRRSRCCAPPGCWCSPATTTSATPGHPTAPATCWNAPR